MENGRNGDHNPAYTERPVDVRFWFSCGYFYQNILPMLENVLSRLILVER